MKAKDYKAMVETARVEVARIRDTFRAEIKDLSPADRIKFIRAIDGRQEQ